MKQDARARDEGCQAGRCCRALAARRYRAGTTQSWSWSSGAIEGNAQRLKKGLPPLDGTVEP